MACKTAEAYLPLWLKGDQGRGQMDKLNEFSGKNRSDLVQMVPIKVTEIFSTIYWSLKL
jgi:hypothetical protein